MPASPDSPVAAGEAVERLGFCCPRSTVAGQRLPGQVGEHRAHGATVRLTLNGDVEFYLQQQVQQATNIFGAHSVSAAVLDAHGGEVLAMPSSIAQWNGSMFANLPISQGLSMPLLQMAGMYQVIANDGVRVSARTAATLRNMLRAVVQPRERAAVTGSRSVADPAGDVVQVYVECIRAAARSSPTSDCTLRFGKQDIQAFDIVKNDPACAYKSSCQRRATGTIRCTCPAWHRRGSRHGDP